MSDLLISFLGRASKEIGEYQFTEYDFGDGEQGQRFAFFGWALLARNKPERLLILGTAGSMWDHLFEGDLDLGSQEEERRIHLADAVLKGAVTQQMLGELTPLLTAALGCAVQLKIIPYCREAAEQVALLGAIADHVVDGNTVELDITHGFRHLPMLGFLAALYLRRIRRATIEHIWYAAYDHDSGLAPVHDLNGLLEIADWLDAMAIYDYGGDYGVFSSLLGENVGQQLAVGSFFEATNQVGKARKHVGDALNQLETDEHGIASRLFRPELQRRLSWANNGSLYSRQRQLCLEFLDHGRYREAAIAGYEAFITGLVQAQPRNLEPEKYKVRNDVSKAFDDQQKLLHRGRQSPLWKPFKALRDLRNVLAHGGQASKRDTAAALADVTAMDDFLRPLLVALLPENFVEP